MAIEISDELLAVFHATVVRRNGSYLIEIPDSAVEHGTITSNGTYRIGVLEAHDAVDPDRPTASSTTTDETTDAVDAPVGEGDQLDVAIEDVGDEGDGIARVDPGYIIFVPDTEPGDRVRIEITDVTESYAFGEVVEELLDNPTPS